ncbi:ATP-binding cassette sub-family C member Sur [Armigeres subalbatus]|uniref:ATP-binding cassette sub-family C member Sur n=1 Tax=Armigeres subalbatus TaxID=124917 RepID=UPI002ECFB534
MICDIAAAGRLSGRTLGYIALVGGEGGEGSFKAEQVADICFSNFFGLVVHILTLAATVGVLVYTSWNFVCKRHNLLALHNLRLTLVLTSILVGVCDVAQHSVIIHHLGQLKEESRNGSGEGAVVQKANERANGLGDLEDSLLETGRNNDANQAGFDNGMAMETAVMGLCSGCVGLVSILVGAVFVRVIELKDECGLLYVTITVQGVQSVVKWCQFEYIYGVTNNVTVLSALLAMGSSLVLAALTFVDGITVYQERTSSARRHISSIMSKDTTASTATAGSGYKTTSVPFLSRITFWWITPLLWRGFVEPLELENLGKLPEGDTSRFHYDQFLSIYQRFKTSTHALWRCYVLNCWRMFLAGGVFKLLGDLCALVGPLCISNIVDYIAKPVTSSSSSSSSSALTMTGGGPANGVIPEDDSPVPAEFNHGNQSLLTDGTAATAAMLGGSVQLGPLTWSELLANGWFVAVIVLVASLAQGTFSQASTHIMDMEGIKLKNALQGLVYRKTLLLSTSCFYSEGNRESRKVSRQKTDDENVASNINKAGNDASTDDKSHEEHTSNSHSVTPKINSTVNRIAIVNLSDTGDVEAKDIRSSIRNATAPGTDVFTAIPPATPPELTTSIEQRQEEQPATEKSKPKIKHEIPDAIDDTNDRGQQFDNDSGASHSGRTRVSRLRKSDLFAGCLRQQAKAGASEATSQKLEEQEQNENRKSSTNRDATDNRQDRGSDDGGNSAATDAGTITNLMSDDAFNVMAFVKIAHYVWAIPLKIGMVMFLLYRLLGVSTIIGSFVCIVTMTPLQFMIGKYMSANSKKTAECTDERLRRINEVLLGIKLIKLSAWEGVFREKIFKARRKELKHLDWDSCYWTMMMLLTHISSVLITFVTVAVFIHLESHESTIAEEGARDGRIEFTAARLFASLALFNQLTVPLFIFPITIPIILSAGVSTRRLEVFLRRPEVRTVVARRIGRTTSFDGLRRGNVTKRDVSRRVATLDKAAVIRDREDSVDGKYDEMVLEEDEEDTKWEQEGAMHFECFDLPECATVSSENTPKDETACSESSEGESEIEQDEQIRRAKFSVESSSTDGTASGTPGDISTKRLEQNDDHQSTISGGGIVGSGLNHRVNQQTTVLGTHNSQLSGCARLLGNRLRQKPHHRQLMANESIYGTVSTNDDDDDGREGETNQCAQIVTVRDGRFQWGCFNETRGSSNSQNTGSILQISQLTIPRGKLTIVVGRSGSGKSSLLAALLREINHLSGEVIWNQYSTIAYVPQRPWLLNANVRENILFGEPFRPKRYHRVLKACALKPDIELMPDGDMSEIGERGIKLSGGQRQRIVIARALYSPASVVIMDDPLSSLDNEVAKFVFDHGIRRMLTRQKRTVVMVTQMLQLVYSADHIIAMEAFAVEATGTLSEIENNYSPILRKWNAIITKEQQSKETQLSPGRTARERWKLFKNVSRLGFLRSHATEEFYEPPDAPLLYRPSPMQRHSSSSLFGSRFHTHDLPLPIDECCHGENVRLRRHYSKRYRNAAGESSRVVRGFSDGVAAAVTAAAVTMERKTESVERDALGNSVVRSWSLQTKRDIGSPSQIIDGRLLPACGAPTSMSPTELDHPSPLDSVTSAAATGDRPGHERFRFSDTCSDLHKFGFRQFLRRMSITGRHRQAQRSNSAARDRRGVPSSVVSKTSSLKNLAEEDDADRDRSLSGAKKPFQGMHKPLKRLFSNESRYSEETDEDSWEELNNGEQISNRLIYDEERKYGKIPARMYWLYLKSCGKDIVATFFLSALAQQGLRVYTDFWLQSWTERTQRQSHDTNGVDPADIEYNFKVYAVLSVICILLSVVCFPAGQKAGSNARKRLHQQLIVAVLKNPIHFFQTVPLGRIMSRLSIDVSVVDKKIAATSQKLLQFVLLCLCAVLINSVVTPYFILLTIPICGIYYVVQKFYRCTSRELQRLESLTYSPIISHFSETIDGLTTIRAYQQESRFTETLFQRLEANNVAQVILNCSNRWLGIALDYLGAIIVFVAILSALITTSLSPESASSSLIGLAISYALLIPIYLNWVVKLAAEMEMYIGAVERIQFYIDSSQERIRERSKLKHKPVSISWPQKGDIVFENVSLRYESQKENVITNLNLTIPAGQRIGICGRTGSGKSSLALALFGVLEIVGGRILIDDVDIGTIHSDELRCRLSIIPQDAVLFGGTLRENLDPRGHFSDLDLWNSLEMAQLKDFVVALPDALDTRIGEETSILSAGQKQLFCLARSVLRGSVCLVLDEATSSLDSETEKLVLDAAGKAFKGRTVITIAHRLHSLFDYDRVIVLEHGGIIEDGCPRTLRRTADSKFAIMLKASSTEYRKPQEQSQHRHQKRQHNSFDGNGQQQWDEGETSV